MRIDEALACCVDTVAEKITDTAASARGYLVSMLIPYSCASFALDEIRFAADAVFMNWFKTAAELSDVVLHGDTLRAIERISELLRSLPATPYHCVLDLEFTNPKHEIAQRFDQFLIKEKATGPVAAVYTETNGFDINPDRWYFDVFAYNTHSGHEDMDWLSDWQSGRFPEETLTGMESLHDTEDMCRKDQEDAMYHCSLLVVAKFQDLIRQSVPLMTKLDVPLLATGHEYDFIAEFTPVKLGAGS